MVTQKVKRQSGRRYNKNYDPENGDYYIIYYNEWDNWRDGARELKGHSRKKDKPWKRKK